MTNSVSYSSIETQRQIRLNKMHKLIELGHDPFTPYARRDKTLYEVKQFFIQGHVPDQIEGQPNLLTKITLAGRLKSKRVSGKIAFATVEDESLPEGFQFVFKKDMLPDVKTWQLNLRNGEQLDSLSDLLKGKKIFETRAMDTSDLDKNLSQVKVGDLVVMVDLVGQKRYFFNVEEVLLFKNIDEAFEKHFDFSRVRLKGDTRYLQSASQVKKWYSGALGPEYLNRMQTNGFVALKLSKNTNYNNSGQEAIHLTFSNFKDLFDEGDFIQATGTLQRSQSGEPSLFVESFQILTKSLRPLPKELTDLEQIYRQRYVDMRLHPEVRQMFRQKSRFWSATREFMVKHGFTELTMPTMEETTGGAEATPFITHHQALDEDFYLRISSELHQKRMIVGGFEKIFDIDKNFRNEGIDDEHLQEFTQMEFYWAYASYEDLLDYGEKLIKYVIQETFGTLELDYNGKKVDWSRTWPRLTYYEFVEKYAGIRLTEYDTLEKLQDLATELGLTFDQTDGYGRLMDLIYKKTARPKCIDPVWLIDQPVEISPLAKRKPDNPKLTQRLQLIAYGSELCNGYSELNDPIDQLARFEEQQRLRESGDDEAMMLDRDFVTALEIGMPPTAGFGYSERLFSVLARRPIRETVPFPLMKRKVGDGGKAKKTMVAHAIILDKPEISIWTKFNTVAHLAASLGAREGKKLMHIDHSRTTDGEKIPMPIQHAILVKKTDQPEKLLDLKRMAEQKGLRVTCFTEEMEVNIGHEEVHHVQENKSKDQIGWLGVMIFGKKSDVEELTDDLELFS